MNQNRLNRWFWPYKARARPNKTGIIPAVIVALVLFFFPQSFAEEADPYLYPEAASRLEKERLERTQAEQ